MTLIDRIEDLINIPSVTGEEAGVLEYLETVLTDMGLPVYREAVSETRWNLYAGWQHALPVVFCTHVDTVPPFFPAVVEDARILGRGACDTKGIMAAMLEAGRQLIAEGKQPSYLFVVGEETDSIGAKTAASSGRSARAIIVGEPTDNHLATGHKGVLSYTLRTEGVAAHSAYPERGASAIHLLLDLIDGIRNRDWGSSPVLGEATLNIGSIEGGVAMNTFAPGASATFMHRIVDNAQQRSAELVELVDQRAEITFHSVSEPQLLETVDGFALKAVNFGTDIPYLVTMAPCLLFGPGSVHEAHTPHESIAIVEVHEAVQLYRKLYNALTDTP
ncbi:MAG: M20/M25/M40 family metallo-hydrolase [Bacteroidota bacterium]|nr:M20/M25/M40 family metallo-hydrolase [Bacteroidota bacterium]